jgi:hypothetical protein
MLVSDAGVASFPFSEIIEFLKVRYPEASIGDEGQSVVSEQNVIPEAPRNLVQTAALRELEVQAPSHPLITLIGMAGTGKTTSAAAFARWALETQLVAHVIWLNGSPLNPEPVIAQLYRLLGIRRAFESVEDAIPEIERILAANATLIVLDDAAEGPLAIMVEVVRRTASGGSRLVATTINAELVSAFPDMAVLSLEPLSSVEGVLFLRQLLQPDVRLRPDEAKDIAIASAGQALVLRLIAGQLNSGVGADEVLNRLRLVPESDSDRTLFQAINRCYAALSFDERDFLASLATFQGVPVSIRTLSTVLGRVDLSRTWQDARRLEQVGIVDLENGKVVLHPLVIDYLRRHKLKTELSAPRTLYITVDPKLMARDEIVELLNALNALYTRLGGSELLIREDEIGHFARAEVFV